MTKMGSKIKELRKAKGLTLQGLAYLSLSSKSYIWELENIDRNVSAKKLRRISIYLDTTVDFLLDDSRDKMGLSDVETGILSLLRELSPEDLDLGWRILILLHNKEK